MLFRIKTKFTKWYVKHGYTRRYTPLGNVIFVCPTWVKWLAIWFFSPGVYLNEKLAEFYKPVCNTHEFLRKTFNFPKEEEEKEK